MTSLQIKYFLTAARCLNFTEAARQLYISQPALSQQIAAMEKELNMQLFIRSKGKVFLTPGAVILMHDLPKYEKMYETILKNAQYANEGRSGVLRIGFLEGQNIAPDVVERYFQFREQFPNIAVDASCGSFGTLQRMLAEDEVDLIYTADFEVEDNPSYCSEPVAEDYAVILLSRFHPLAKEKITGLKQLKSVPMITLRRQESTWIAGRVEDDCRRAGFVPHVKYADSPDEQILWTEIGLGFSVTNQDSYGCLNKNLICLDQIHLAERKFVFGWKKDNVNPAVALFVNCMLGDRNSTTNR
ncbi:MAG: LysR family transcriptional regulator [Lachnospiraceae bacterium]|nr:LysR family transcriptional regulator [Lachnospiraceae bacterium]